MYIVKRAVLLNMLISIYLLLFALRSRKQKSGRKVLFMLMKSSRKYKIVHNANSLIFQHFNRKSSFTTGSVILEGDRSNIGTNNFI